MNQAIFDTMAGEYSRCYPVGMGWCDADGRWRAIWRSKRLPRSYQPASDLAVTAMEQTLRWGESTLVPASDGWLIFAVPLMENSRLMGGLVAWLHEDDVFAHSPGQPHMDLRRACTQLRELAESQNVTNAALLAEGRRQYVFEKSRAEAIHSLKRNPHLDLRSLMLDVEPRLLAALGRGDRGSARDALNQVLVAVMHHTGLQLDLVKGFFVELVAVLSRTAIEAGASAGQVLQESHAAVGRLTTGKSLESVTADLRDAMERLLETLSRRRMDHLLIAAGLEMMQKGLGQALSRDQVADQLGLSHAHFSRLMKRATGRTFTQILTQLRVDHMADRLVRTDVPIAILAVEAGFPDQSYATKVFRRVTGQTPRAFREKHQMTKK